MKDILISWIAGSGKWTQARELQKHLGENLQYFEPWSVFRAFGSNDNIIGNYTRKYTSAGRLLPDDFFKNVLGLVFTCLDEGNRLLVDWFPRMYSQKKMFDDIVKEQNREFVVFNLVLSEEKAKERLLNRLICPSCGATYSKLLTPEITHCSIDNKELVTRVDDQSEEAIAERFALFHEQTEPIINEYREEGRAIDIDAELPIEEITKIMLENIGE